MKTKKRGRGEGIITKDLIELPHYPERVRLETEAVINSDWTERSKAMRALETFLYHQLLLSQELVRKGQCYSRELAIYTIPSNARVEWKDFHPEEQGLYYGDIASLNRIRLCLLAEKLANELVADLAQCVEDAPEYPNEIHIFYLDDAQAVRNFLHDNPQIFFEKSMSIGFQSCLLRSKSRWHLADRP